MEKKNRGKLWLVLLAVLFVGAMAGITVWAWPYIKMLTQPEAQAKLGQLISSWGALGVLALLGIQVLQIVVAFIPGEPVELLAGVLYGGVFGTLICIAGCVLASSMVFWLTRKLGGRLTQKLFTPKRMAEYAFLRDAKKQELLIFVLFLIPGTPKDMLTYLVALTPMRLPQFLLLSNLARLPSLVSSTFLGAAARQGQWGLVLALFLVTGALGIAGILLKDRFLKFSKTLAAGRKNKTK